MTFEDVLNYYYALRKFREENAYSLPFMKLCKIDKELQELVENLKAKSPELI